MIRSGKGARHVQVGETSFPELYEPARYMFHIDRDLLGVLLEYIEQE